MLTEQHRKESLARAYVQAVAGKCGMSCSHRDFDYGIDITLHDIQRRNKRYVESGFKLDIQAKSTVAATVEDDHVAHDLEVKNYDDLRQDQVGCPRILVLLVLPRSESEWLTQSEGELIVRHCAYWLSIKGQEPTENTSTVRVRIPRANLFSVDGLAVMMRRIRNGEEL